MTAVALAATLHDATGALIGDVHRHLGALQTIYAGGVRVATSPPTAPVIVDALRDAGVYAGSPGSNERGPLYRSSVRAALGSMATHVHYVDFDRALHWMRSAPAEIPVLLRQAATHDVVLVGRTERAHRSHHRPLYATEMVANRVIADRLGWTGRVDGLVPSFVLARRAALTLLRASRVRGPAVYGEWLALVAASAPRIAYTECRGLDWETPDRDPDGVRAEGIDAWRTRWDTATEWRLRTKMAETIVRGFDRTWVRRSAARPPDLVRLTLRVPAGPKRMDDGSAARGR